MVDNSFACSFEFACFSFFTVSLKNERAQTAQADKKAPAKKDSFLILGSSTLFTGQSDISISSMSSRCAFPYM
jgi:hypothetical protein